MEGVVDLAGNNVVFQRVWPEKIVNHCISQTQAKSFNKVLGLLIKICPFFFNNLLEQDGNMAGNFPDHINLCLAFIDALIELFIQFDPVKGQNDDTFPVQVAIFFVNRVKPLAAQGRKNNTGTKRPNQRSIFPQLAGKKKTGRQT